ncbi:MAG: hypothetical protein Q8876_10315, partial [Bacillota bacterium]|nr:hypothetical protein [Bacillota bacterium]
KEKGQAGELRKHLEVLPDMDENTMKQLLPLLVPYVKNKHFVEEAEYRLIFPNNDYSLSKCIHYRDIGNGSKVPYIKIRPKGEYGITERVPSVDAEYDRDIDHIQKERRGSKTMIIRVPFCATQQSIYEKLWEKVKKKNSERQRGDDIIHILCDGHFPITKITVAPMPNMERIKEQIEHFCKSKYWLRQVDVVTSKIPYAASLLK